MLDLYGIPVLTTTVQQLTVQGQTNTLSADFFMGDAPLGHRQDCALPVSCLSLSLLLLKGSSAPVTLWGAVGVLGAACEPSPVPGTVSQMTQSCTWEPWPGAGGSRLLSAAPF